MSVVGNRSSGFPSQFECISNSSSTNEQKNQVTPRFGCVWQHPLSHDLSLVSAKSMQNAGFPNTLPWNLS